MPFITEEIWDKIKDPSEPPIIVSPWPQAKPEFDFAAESEKAELFKEAVYKIRNIRGEMNIAPDVKAAAVFKTERADFAGMLDAESVQIKALAKLNSVTIDPQYVPDKTDASAVMYGIEIYLPLKGLIDFDKERARLEKELNETRAELDKVNAKLSNEKFISKAPSDVIEKEKAKRDEFSQAIEKLRTSLEKLNRN
jgi:valyl-tRNA synthetase